MVLAPCLWLVRCKHFYSQTNTVDLPLSAHSYKWQIEKKTSNCKLQQTQNPLSLRGRSTVLWIQISCWMSMSHIHTSLMHKGQSRVWKQWCSYVFALVVIVQKPFTWHSDRSPHNWLWTKSHPQSLMGFDLAVISHHTSHTWLMLGCTAFHDKKEFSKKHPICCCSNSVVITHF